MFYAGKSNHELCYVHNRPISTPDSTKSRTRISTAKSVVSRLASAWREIQGLNNWENLVEPLDPLLRHEIIRYGELVAACYKAFDLDPNSKRYLNCKYGKRSMLREAGWRIPAIKSPNTYMPQPRISTFQFKLGRPDGLDMWPWPQIRR
ncbi:Phospholipase A1-Ialpha2, chloroplastic [Sesamum alatum]|uniref:Phospholipase A1-Ialpha2, chloroplastic n=1 Tax=Sesamum alatum TaxID=300844 RepID=A0AAE1Y1V1_9LAMI|nr:Phospholipase A1-Ialpha2, chloroplastic [Sesamum alatum]